jgi:exosortase
LFISFGVAFAWAYWPTLVEIVWAWEKSPDYSHGYLVLPVCIYFLWARRGACPAPAGTPAWPGLVLISASIAVRFGAAQWFLTPLDGWSILLWTAGVVWLFFGGAVLRWSLPAILFLGFAIPLPFRVERALSVPLQRFATTFSTWTLQCFGQLAIAEGNVIHLSHHDLKVAAACSGLRIFMGIVALAFAYCVLLRRSWWEKAILALSTIPIALIANCTRIVITGLLYQCVSGEAAHKFSHDFAGWVMIPYAAALFALVVWYLTRLFPEIKTVGVKEIWSRRQHTGSKSATESSPHAAHS